MNFFMIFTPSQRVIKLQRMRWTGHMARQGKERNACRVLMGNSEGKRPLGTQDVDGRIILK
jgi:hypothetical protein